MLFHSNYVSAGVCVYIYCHWYSPIAIVISLSSAVELLTSQIQQRISIFIDVYKFRQGIG